jgi:hypothetical protein
VGPLPVSYRDVARVGVGPRTATPTPLPAQKGHWLKADALKEARDQYKGSRKWDRRPDGSKIEM